MVRIFKFGGASVKDDTAIENLKNIVLENIGDKLVVVVSAMGKTTNALENIAKTAYYKQGSYQSELQKLEKYHLDTCDRLNIEDLAKVRSLFATLTKELGDRVRNWYEYLDAVAAHGELLSTTIISKFISNYTSVKWVDARDIIVTSEDYGEGKINWGLTEERVLKNVSTSNQLTITQGYIARSEKGTTTTLGREGSDFTAAILANILNADSMTVWKDVPGIMNADPKLMDQVELFETLSYQEITEMTYYGAKVIHPKTMVPLAQKGIPLIVRSFLEPKMQGTLISIDENNKVPIPTFILKSNQLVVTLRVKDHSFMDEEKLVKIFSVLNESNVKLNVMQMSALTFTCCFDAHSEKLAKVRQELREQFYLTYNEDLSLATIKNYNTEAMKALPPYREIIIEQQSRAVYHRLYRG